MLGTMPSCVVMLAAVLAGANAPVDDPMVRLGDADGFLTNSVVVRVAPGVAPAVLGDGRPAFVRSRAGGGKLRANQLQADERGAVEALASIKAVRIEPALQVLPADADRARRFRLDRYYRVVLPPLTDAAAALDAMGRLRADAVASLIETSELEPLGGMAEAPDDPEFGQQYSMENSGQVVQGIPGVADADVDAGTMWEVAAQSPFVIAFLDAGVDSHVELGNRILPGWNAVDGSSDTSAVCSSHGTHVVGVAAAAGNNGLGIAGMNWAAKILPIKVVSGCSGTETSVADGITFAVNAGADILNMSLQYYTGSSVLQDAVSAAADAGVLMVAAAGNNNTKIAFPAKWNSCVAVAATTNQDKKWSGSNVGPQVDLSAPGADVYSLVGTFSYGYKSGTSFAVPHVSGCASLMWSINPALTATELRAILMESLEDVETPGFDELTGWGRLNAATAVEKAIASLSKPGDVDGDGVVDGLDLGLLLSAWETADAAADLDGNGQVNGADLGILLADWS
jgi:subtilisin family serine protease